MDQLGRVLVEVEGLQVHLVEVEGSAVHPASLFPSKPNSRGNPAKGSAMSASETKQRSRRGQPCPVCNNTSKGCSVNKDGLHFCRGRPADPLLWQSCGQADGNPDFHLWRRTDDPRVYKNNGDPLGPIPRTKPPARTAEAKDRTDWDQTNRELVGNLTVEMRTSLANNLGIPLRAFDHFPGLGFCPKDPVGTCWTWPEVDAQGRIVGIQRRYFDGHKRCMSRSHRGLVLPSPRPGGSGTISWSRGQAIPGLSRR